MRCSNGFYDIITCLWVFVMSNKNILNQKVTRISPLTRTKPTCLKRFSFSTLFETPMTRTLWFCFIFFFKTTDWPNIRKRIQSWTKKTRMALSKLKLAIFLCFWGKCIKEYKKWKWTVNSKTLKMIKTLFKYIKATYLCFNRRSYKFVKNSQTERKKKVSLIN